MKRTQLNADRRSRRSRVIFAALCVALFAAVSACGATSGSGGKTPTVTLTFWHYWTDRADLLTKMAADYQKQTGVKVKMELVPGDTLGQKFQAAAQAHQLPDISAGWIGIGDQFAPYAKQGEVLNLTDATKAGGWFDRFTPSTVSSVSFAPGNQWGVDPGPYLVPLDVNNMQFFYNKALFAKAGITNPPGSMQDLIADSGMLRAKGIQPLVSGFSSWALDSMAQMYIWNVIGQKDMDAAFRGKSSYNTPEWINFLTTFKTLATSKVFADGILGDDLPAAETLFANGQAAMIYDGSWAIGVFNTTNPDFKDYGVSLPPTLGNDPLYIPGGTGSTAFVVGTSPHKAEAVAFLKWLTDGPQQKRYAESSFNIPANTQVASSMPLNTNIKAFSDAMGKVTPPIATGMQGAVVTTMDKGLQLIIAGTDTPAAVAARMQAAAVSGHAK